jgi:hypothetical protein
MTAREVLTMLHDRGIRVGVSGDHLRLKPLAAITPELLATVREHKPELLRLLAPGVSTPAECGWCGAALAAYLLDLAGHPAVLCPVCRRWTYAGGGA